MLYVLILVAVLTSYATAVEQREVGARVGWPKFIPQDLRALHDPDEGECFLLEQDYLENMIVNGVITLTIQNDDGDNEPNNNYDNVDYIVMSDLVFGDGDGEIDANLVVEPGVTIWFGLRPTEEYGEDNYWEAADDLAQICRMTFRDGHVLTCGVNGGNPIVFSPWPDLGNYYVTYTPYFQYPLHVREEFWDTVRETYPNVPDYCAGGFLFESSGNQFFNTTLVAMLGCRIDAEENAVIDIDYSNGVNNVETRRWITFDGEDNPIPMYTGDAFGLKLQGIDPSVLMDGTTLAHSLFTGICMMGISTGGGQHCQVTLQDDSEITSTYLRAPKFHDQIWEEDRFRKRGILGDVENPPPDDLDGGCGIFSGRNPRIENDAIGDDARVLITNSSVDLNSLDGIFVRGANTVINTTGSTVNNNGVNDLIVAQERRQQVQGQDLQKSSFTTAGIRINFGDNQILNIDNSNINENDDHGIYFGSDQGEIEIVNSSTVNLNQEVGIHIFGDFIDASINHSLINENHLDGIYIFGDDNDVIATNNTQINQNGDQAGGWANQRDEGHGVAIVGSRVTDWRVARPGNRGNASERNVFTLSNNSIIFDNERDGIYMFATYETELFIGTEDIGGILPISSITFNGFNGIFAKNTVRCDVIVRDGCQIDDNIGCGIWFWGDFVEDFEFLQCHVIPGPVPDEDACFDCTVTLLENSTVDDNDCVPNNNGDPDDMSGILAQGGGHRIFVNNSNVAENTNRGIYDYCYDRSWVSVTNGGLVNNNGDVGIEIYHAEMLEINASGVMTNGANGTVSTQYAFHHQERNGLGPLPIDIWEVGEGALGQSFVFDADIRDCNQFGFTISNNGGDGLFFAGETWDPVTDEGGGGVEVSSEITIDNTHVTNNEFMGISLNSIFSGNSQITNSQIMNNFENAGWPDSHQAQISVIYAAFSDLLIRGNTIGYPDFARAEISEGIYLAYFQRVQGAIFDRDETLNCFVENNDILRAEYGLIADRFENLRLYIRPTTDEQEVTNYAEYNRFINNENFGVYIHSLPNNFVPEPEILHSTAFIIDATEFDHSAIFDDATHIEVIGGIRGFEGENLVDFGTIRKCSFTNADTSIHTLWDEGVIEFADRRNPDIHVHNNFYQFSDFADVVHIYDQFWGMGENTLIYNNTFTGNFMNNRIGIEAVDGNGMDPLPDLSVFNNHFEDLTTGILVPPFGDPQHFPTNNFINVGPPFGINCDGARGQNDEWYNYPALRYNNTERLDWNSPLINLGWPGNANEYLDVTEVYEGAFNTNANDIGCTGGLFAGILDHYHYNMHPGTVGNPSRWIEDKPVDQNHPEFQVPYDFPHVPDDEYEANADIDAFGNPDGVMNLTKNSAFFMRQGLSVIAEDAVIDASDGDGNPDDPMYFASFEDDLWFQILIQFEDAITSSFQGCDISGSMDGFYISSVNQGGQPNEWVEIEDCYIHDITEQGVAVYSSQVNIFGDDIEPGFQAPFRNIITRVGPDNPTGVSERGVYLWNNDADYVTITGTAVTECGPAVSGEWKSSGIVAVSSDPIIDDALLANNGVNGLACFDSAPQLTGWEGVSTDFLNNGQGFNPDMQGVMDRIDGAEMSLQSGSGPIMSFCDIVEEHLNNGFPWGYLIYKDGFTNPARLEVHDSFWGGNDPGDEGNGNYDQYFWDDQLDNISTDDWSNINIDNVSFDRGLALFGNGEYESASRMFARAINDNPNSGEAVTSVRYLLYCYKRLQRDFDDLRGFYTNRIRNLNRCELSRRIRFIMPRILTEEGRFEEAIAAYDEMSNNAEFRLDSLEARFMNLQWREIFERQGGQLDAIGVREIRSAVSETARLFRQVDFDERTSLGVLAELPEAFALHPVFPNPFNSTANISYDLKTDADVSLRLFDLSGREVAHLVDCQQAAGKYSLVWNADGAASGVYMVLFKASGSESFEINRKVVLMK